MMAIHEHFVRLAAMAVTEELSPRDAFSIANHVQSCPECRAAETELVTDHLRLRALVDAQPVGATMRAAVLDAVQERRAISPWRVLVMTGLLLLLGVVGAAILVGSRPRTHIPAEFLGVWTTRNCATLAAPKQVSGMACDRWGDGTTLRLEIGSKEPTVVHLIGVGLAGCVGTASDESTSVPPRPGAGTFLLIRFDKAACGPIELGDDMTLDVYRDKGSDTLWTDHDHDVWGHQWNRSS
jgi:hypothetical protein